MKIWILSPDVSFAHTLKQQIKGLGHKVELFFDVLSLSDFLSKNKKDKSKRPDLAFFDLEPGQTDSLDLYLSLKQDFPEVAGLIIFCTHVGYGHYMAYMKAAGAEEEVPYIQKGRVEKELEKLLLEWSQKMR